MDKSNPNSSAYTIQEVEHENLILGTELISIYKKRIGELELENAELKARLVQTPLPLNPVPNRRKIVTVSELREALESRSSKVIGEVPNA